MKHFGYKSSDYFPNTDNDTAFFCRNTHKRAYENAIIEGGGVSVGKLFITYE